MKKLSNILRNKTLALTVLACFVTINLSNAMENEISETEIVVNKDFERSLRKEWIEIVCSKNDNEKMPEVCNEYHTKK